MRKRKDLLFYTGYQAFYKMAGRSIAFAKYCEKAFGEDFSQDGFSDVTQLNLILSMVSLNDRSKVLDLGCGNGKMLQYIQQKTGADIYGLDYSKKAIKQAVKRTGLKKQFKVALLGENVFEDLKFDLVISMDSMYFAPDMNQMVLQIMEWLTPEGVFLCGYQEGDVMEKTENEHSTVLAKALRQNGLAYQSTNYTSKTYHMLKRKRESILSLKEEFLKEKNKLWYQVILGQTEMATVPYEEFCVKNARYIYMVEKNKIDKIME